MFGAHETHISKIRATLGKIFGLPLTTLKEEEITEAFTMADLRGTAPEIFARDANELQKLGDAALDYYALRILRKKGFIGDFETAKQHLVGNAADQPLNKLFDAWGLKDLVLSTNSTDSLSPHQKADAVEAIFGLLDTHGLLNDAVIEKHFEGFWPKIEKAPAIAPRMALTSERLCSIPANVLPVLMKTHPSEMARLADSLLEMIAKDFANKPAIDSQMLARANIIIREYKKHERFFEQCLNDDTLSPEKFRQLYPKPAASYFYPDPTRPIHAQKIAHFLNAPDKQRLATGLITELKIRPEASAPQFAAALQRIIADFKPYEFLIEAFNTLPEARQALLPDLQPLKHFKMPERGGSMIDIKILSLELNEFKACAAMLDPSDIRAQQIKTEIQHRMRGAGIKPKTLAHYQSYLDCLTPPAAASTTPMAALHGATGSAASSSSAEATPSGARS